jgi:cytochrome c553
MSKIICLATVVVASLLFCTRTRADDKSAATYKAKCSTCHGADGKGDTPAGKVPKRVVSRTRRVKASDDDLAGIIERAKGRCPAIARA